MNEWFEQIEQLKRYLYIDENDLLREKCTNENLLNSLIEKGEKILWEYNGEDRIEVIGTLGNLYRIKGDLQMALPCLERYKNACLQNGNHEQGILSLFRFAEALKYNRQYSEALAYFEEALERGNILRINTYENMAWKNLGKCYVEMGMMKQAESCFLKALLLCKQLGDEKQLVATEQALSFMMHIKK